MSGRPTAKVGPQVSHYPSVSKFKKKIFLILHILAAQRLSGVAIALDLCSLFGEKIHSRYIQATLESTIISKELLGRDFFKKISKKNFY